MAETIVTVKLTPKASKNEIQGWMTDPDGKNILKVCVTAVPEKGKANKALISLLSKELRISKSSIGIIKGEADRIKTVRIEGEVGGFWPGS